MTIKSIEINDISKLTSGQVIIDLKSIVKEIVENSIDSGSTKIDLTFIEYGLDQVILEDNGDGIHPSDYESVCLRGYTSKLEEFHDLEKLSTLGFRGEALNSICCLSQLKIVTSVKYPVVHELCFDKLGRLIKQEKCPPTSLTHIGTKLLISDLFKGLPVRFKNFEKNIKKEFNKCVNLLIQYLIIYPHIKFSIFNVSNKKKQVIFNTLGGAKSTVLDNMMNIFGSTGSKGLLPISIDINSDIRLEGFISNFSFGLGRSIKDRQFLYVNQRPIAFKKLTKLINEVFQTFNHVQCPVFVIDLKIKSEILDLNLVPDKTMVFIHDETKVLEIIRERLVDYFESQENYLYPRNDVVAVHQLDRTENSPRTADKTSEVGKADIILKENQGQFTSKPTVEEISLKDFEELPVANEIPCDFPTRLEEVNGASEVSKVIELGQPDSLRENLPLEMEEEEITQLESPKIFMLSSKAGNIECESLFVEQEIDDEREDGACSSDSPIESQISSPKSSNLSTHKMKIKSNSTAMSSSAIETSAELINVFEATEVNAIEDNYGVNFFPILEDQDEIKVKIGNKEFEDRTTKRIKRESIHNVTAYVKVTAPKYIRREQFNVEIAERVVIDDIGLAGQQEAKLCSYIISKSDFEKMKVIGQFNLGFILVKRETLDDHSNIFIIDQHASDEKYNFEKLFKEWEINFQKLIAPVKLELNVIERSLVLEHREVFQKNGFIIEEDETGEAINLTTLPTYKNIMFSMDDFYELIDLISTNPYNKSIKLSKIRNILAMKACRKSIMIGKPLSSPVMRQVVNNLSHLNKPWNCPHGRPTMRHLIETTWQSSLADYEV